MKSQWKSLILFLNALFKLFNQFNELSSSVVLVLKVKGGYYKQFEVNYLIADHNKND